MRALGKNCGKGSRSHMTSVDALFASLAVSLDSAASAGSSVGAILRRLGIKSNLDKGFGFSCWIAEFFFLTQV